LKYLILIITALTFLQTGFPSEGFTKFTDSYIPEGICTLNAGNLVVASVDSDNVFQELLTKFSQNAAILNQAAYSETGRMKYDNVMHKIWILIDKQFYLVDPADLSSSSFFDITSLSIDTDQIYDISTGLPFPSSLDPINASYSDFDFIYRGNQIDLFVAGFYQAWHFILRIRLVSQAVQSAAVIITSGATLSPFDNSPHGVAVNSQGIVLTTLGWPGTVTNSDQPVYFGIDYPEDPNQKPEYLFDSYQSFSSCGMTTDEYGNFYVASGWCGGGAAGGGSSCVLFLPASLDTVFAYPFQSLYANPRDVAIDNENGLAYITDADMDYFGNNDAIWVMQMSPVKVSEEINSQYSCELFQNYPNPFNPTTKISWQSPVSCIQTLKVYDILGNEVKTLVNEYRPAGSYEISFDASNLASGIYFYRLQAGKYNSVKKMILVK